MEAWLSQGDQLILMIDANEDIRSFQMAIQHTGMREALLHWHGNNAPATVAQQFGVLIRQCIEQLSRGKMLRA
jgi:hypothetical protein